MALALINIGPQNLQTGDSLFVAFTKINAAITSINSGFGSSVFNGAAGQYAITANGNVTSGQSFGELISAGTTNTDVALLVQNQAATSQFLKIFGDGHGFFGPSSSLGLSWTTTGVYTLAAPTSAGTPLTVNCTVGAQIAAFGPTTNGYIGVSDGSGNVSQLGVGGGEGWVGTNGAVAFAIRTSATDAIKINTSGAVTIPAPGGGSALTLNGVSGAYAETINASSASGNSLGLNIAAGTTNADAALLIRNQATTAIFMKIAGDGSGTLGPTGALGLSWKTTGAMAIAAPSSGVGLTVTGPANNKALTLQGSLTSGQSYGLLIQAGTTSADTPFQISNAAASVNYLVINGVGNVAITPSSGTALAAYATPSSGFGLDIGGAVLGTNYITLANNGTYLLPAGSSVYYLVDDAGGAVAWGINAVGTPVINPVVTTAYTFSSTLGTAGKMNVGYTGSAYEIQNLTGATRNLYFSMIKIRPTN